VKGSILRAGSRRVSSLVHGVLIAAAISSSLVAQAGWQQQAPPVSPSPRNAAAVAFDSVRGATVLFGGRDESGLFADTWTFDGSTWTLVATPHVPPARCAAAAAFDPDRGVFVMHGGRDANGPLGDTWTFDGVDWVQEQSSPAPSPRLWHAMAFDASRGRVVLFGGFTEPLAYLGDTWEWDGVSWSQVPGSNAPPVRAHHALVYDPTRGILLVGGHRNGPSRYPDTWTFDGAGWQLAIPANACGPRAHAHCAFDPVRSEVLLFGGWEGGDLGDTWALPTGAQNWVARPSGPTPAPRTSAAFAFDTERGEYVLFGGVEAGVSVGDTWTASFAQPAVVPFGTGCIDASLALVRDGGAPAIGGGVDYALEAVPGPGPVVVLGGLSRTDAQGVPLPLPLDGIGLPGCELLVSPDVVLSFGVVDGRAPFSVAFPAQPELLGAEFFLQGLALDLVSVPARLVLSGGLATTIGV
jgi:hypothetical protein